MPTPSDPAIEKKKWYRNVMAIVGLVAGVVGAIYGIIQLVNSDIFKSKHVFHNTEIVLDRSTGMASTFGPSGTKLDAAIHSIREFLVPRQDWNLAYREFGGACDDPSELVVDFGRDNAHRIRTALSNVQSNGQATLVSAILQALGDFGKHRDRIPPGVSKNIVVVTGSGDACTSDPTAAIREELEEWAARGDTVEIQFRFVGVAIPPDQRQQLWTMSEALGGRSLFVETEEQLAEALHHVLVTEPVIADVDGMIVMLNGVVAHLRSLTQAVNAADHDGARSALGAARREFRRTDLPFRDLATRQSREEFRALHQLAGENRDLQDRAIALSESMIPLAERDDVDAFNNAVAEWNAVRETYNANIDSLEQMVRRLEL